MCSCPLRIHRGYGGTMAPHQSGPPNLSKMLSSSRHRHNKRSSTSGARSPVNSKSVTDKWSIRIKPKSQMSGRIRKVGSFATRTGRTQMMLSYPSCCAAVDTTRNSLFRTVTGSVEYWMLSVLISCIKSQSASWIIYSGDGYIH
jgi:hypothetical protein